MPTTVTAMYWAELVVGLGIDDEPGLLAGFPAQQSGGVDAEDGFNLGAALVVVSGAGGGPAAGGQAGVFGEIRLRKRGVPGGHR